MHMLEFLPSPEGVLAIRVSGSIKGEDLDAIMDRLDELMEGRDKIHLFLETQGIGGLELSSLPHYAARTFPLFGKLKRFGRVAVVADQAWVRIGTRMESAILPFIA